MVPLISSCTVGKLGICQLPRFWWKVTLWSHGLLDPEYPPCTSGLDRWVLDFLGMDKEGTINRIASEAVTYPELEAWVTEVSAPSRDPRAIREFNQRIWFRRFRKADPGHGSRKIAETYGDIGLSPEAEIESAVVLNSVQDWSLWSKRDQEDPIAMAMPPLISFCDYGPSGLQVLPRIWLKCRLGSGFDGGKAIEAAVLDQFDLSQPEAVAFVRDGKPDFLGFEEWVLGRRDPRTVGHMIVELNRLVADSGRELEAVETANRQAAHSALQVK